MKLMNAQASDTPKCSKTAPKHIYTYPKSYPYVFSGKQDCTHAMGAMLYFLAAANFIPHVTFDRQHRHQTLHSSELGQTAPDLQLGSVVWAFQG